VPPDVRAALDARRDLIEARAADLAQAAVRARAPWVQGIGATPLTPGDRDAWIRQVAVVAAYRDRYTITGRAALGTTPGNLAQQRDADRASTAVRRARSLSRTHTSDVVSSHAPSLAL
jgi:hypothetical protein